MLKTTSNPDGTPLDVFDQLRAGLARNRAQFFLDVASVFFYGFKAFSETDQTEDLKAITVPTLVLQGDDDQVVPYKAAAVLQHRPLLNSTLKICPGYLHGMHTTHADAISADILAFVKG